MKITALILAAGRGTRAGEGLPKTYREINGQMVLSRTIHAFLTHELIHHVRVVIHKDDLALFQKSIQNLGHIDYVFGGSERAVSVANGVEGLSGDKILIHDGARPFISHAVISRVINALEAHDGAIPALPSTDALWQIHDNKLIQPIDRNQIIRAQTPQGFDLQKYRSLVATNPNALDDAQIAVEGGLNIAWVEGDPQNIKLTFAEDFS